MTYNVFGGMLNLALSISVVAFVRVCRSMCLCLQKLRNGWWEV